MGPTASKRRQDHHFENTTPTAGQKSTKEPPLVLPTFEEGQNVEVFIDHFNDAARRYRWSDADKLFFMKNRIAGPAQELMWALKPSTADDLIRSLRASYGSAAMQDQMRAILSSRRREKGEKLVALQADIRKILMIAYPWLPPDALEEVGRDHFLNAIDRELGDKIRMRGAKTLQEAVRIGNEIESIVRSAEMDGERRRPTGGRFRHVTSQQRQQRKPRAPGHQKVAGNTSILSEPESATRKLPLQDRSETRRQKKPTASIPGGSEQRQPTTGTTG
jgi:hypothetical protein